MEKDTIKIFVDNLPISELYMVQADHEIWEAQEGEANFKVTRHVLNTPNKDGIISLTVSGPMLERQRITNDFIAVYGEPAVPVESEPHMDTAVWLSPNTD